MRIILYLGKGGVGKTTVAAATALRSAELGNKTLVASTDVAHSLGDVLDMPLRPIPAEVAPNLWAQEISVVADIDIYWATLQEYASALIREGVMNSVVADELSAFPGMDEIVSLAHINKQAKEQQFDRVIVDAAPTGETVRLLTMPDTFRWYAAHIGRLETAVMRALKPLAGQVLRGATEVLDIVARIDRATAELRETLSDPETSSYRLVLLPERMVLRETERAVSYLALFDYPVDGIVVNRVLPETNDLGEFFARRRELQQGFLEMIENNFRPLPLWYIPYYADEMVGLEALSSIARDCFGEEDPGAIFYRGPLQELVEQPDGSYVMRIPLPFVSGGDVRMRQRGDELFVTVGGFKREMILPSSLARRRVHAAKLNAGTLEILFEAPDQ
jgi:arsenite-transporting ATPase